MYDFTSFDTFIATTNGQQIGLGECWDYINLIWDHLGSKYWTYPPNDPTATNHGVKWGVLNSDALAANQIDGITYISSKALIKRGDIVITSGGEFGHAGFITSDFTGEGTYQFYTQNYAGRRTVGLDSYDLTEFAGAFRYNAWHPTGGAVNIPERKPFKWVLYARKLRKQNL